MYSVKKMNAVPDYLYDERPSVISYDERNEILSKSSKYFSQAKRDFELYDEDRSKNWRLVSSWNSFKNIWDGYRQDIQEILGGRNIIKNLSLICSDDHYCKRYKPFGWHKREEFDHNFSQAVIYDRYVQRMLAVVSDRGKTMYHEIIDYANGAAKMIDKNPFIKSQSYSSKYFDAEKGLFYMLYRASEGAYLESQTIIAMDDFLYSEYGLNVIPASLDCEKYDIDAIIIKTEDGEKSTSYTKLANVSVKNKGALSSETASTYRYMKGKNKPDVYVGLEWNEESEKDELKFIYPADVYAAYAKIVDGNPNRMSRKLDLKEILKDTNKDSFWMSGLINVEDLPPGESEEVYYDGEDDINSEEEETCFDWFSSDSNVYDGDLPF